MKPREEATLRLQQTLNDCFNEIRFARAAELARCGRFLEAEGILTPDGRMSVDPKELDLLARIAAQQRDYGRARSLWEAALKECPTSALYQRAIECAMKAERVQNITKKTLIITVAAILAAAGFVFAWSMLSRRTAPAHQSDSAKPDPRPNEVPKSGQSALAKPTFQSASTPIALTPSPVPPNALPGPPLSEPKEPLPQEPAPKVPTLPLPGPMPKLSVVLPRELAPHGQPADPVPLHQLPEKDQSALPTPSGEDRPEAPPGSSHAQ